MSELRVLYLTGHPAEAQLSAPIIRRLESDPFFKLHVIKLPYGSPDADILELDTYSVLKHPEWFDIAISPADRVEMLVPTYRIFLQNRPIVRIYSGLAGSGTFDDCIRHALDAFGHVHFCESEEAKQNLIRSGEESWRIHAVGISHLDDLKLEHILTPEAPYAIFLMNPVTVSEEETRRSVADAIHRALQFIGPGGFVLFFPPNGDTYSNIISNELHKLEGTKHAIIYAHRLERSQFLGALSEAELFITNSSSALYEYPALNPKGEVYNPSWRNQERTKPPALKPGGSDEIVRVLKQIDWSDPNLLRKRFFSI